MMTISTKISLFSNDVFISLIIAILFVIFSIVLPIYDNVNGFHNLIFDDYKLTWYDGRSPLNFYLIKNMIENGSTSFQRGYLINDIRIEDYYDFIEKDNKYYPIFSYLSDYFFAGILYKIPFFTDLQLFKMIIFIMIILSSLILILFYHIQKFLGLGKKYASISTIVGGLGTGVLIYSRYLFINNITQVLMCFLLIYVILRNLRKFEKLDLKNELLIFTSLFLLLIFFWPFLLEIIFIFVFFSYFLIKKNLIKHTKSYLSLFLLFIIFAIILDKIFFPNIGDNPRYQWTSNIKNEIRIFDYNIFSAFPNYIWALDYIIYGYHDIFSVWKVNRIFPLISYAFEQTPGNAVFIKSHSLFDSIFGAKGFIYNSPFLIFSIVGILYYKNETKKNLVNLIIALTILILIYCLFNPMWYGGVTPRYNRNLIIPALFLSFFAFYYIQEIEKIFKQSWKVWTVRVLFIILVILSILNVTSLAIRADWTYEHDANLVSYDLVLWPWYPLRTQENIINLYLTEQGESLEWNFGGEAGCKASGSLEGITTDLCNCEYFTYAERKINIPWENIRVNFTACSMGGDGVIGRFYFDRIQKEIFIPNDSCKKETITIKNSTNEHNIVLKSKRYGECIDETVIWKLITIEKI
jgi:hypothetical protein